MIDVVVVGGGCAGLAAARALCAAGYRVRLWEARARVGGRVYTVRPSGLPVPVELGAEFVEVPAPEVLELAETAGLLLVDVGGERWRAAPLRPFGDFWARAQRVLARLGRVGSGDVDFDSFLRSPAAAGLSRADRQWARQFVMAYHAADPARASVRWLSEDGGPRPEAAAGSPRPLRILSGYDRIPELLARDLPAGVVERGLVVRQVEWEPGAVRVSAVGPDGRGRALEARAAVVAVPLGVLAAPVDAEGAIRFDPEPEACRVAARRLAMGSVVRLVLRFREPVWERVRVRVSGRPQALARLGFLHTPGGAFQVWWTLAPVRAPVLVAWAGGPPAARLVRRGRDAWEGTALREMAAHLGLARREVERAFVESYAHDWDSDPYARGAYSYGLVGGADAARVLARPVAGTLFFAGEATDPTGSDATVHGAIASGRRAAAQVQAALEGSGRPRPSRRGTREAGGRGNEPTHLRARATTSGAR